MPELKDIATQIRRDIVRMVHAVQSGHPGGSLGCTDFFTALYFKAMEHQPVPFEMDGKDQDLFFLSNGHISPSSTAPSPAPVTSRTRTGYFPQTGQPPAGPPHYPRTPPWRPRSFRLPRPGPQRCLRRGLTKKLNNDNKIVYALTGDGELQEGQNWEAIMFAAHHKIDNLIATVDYNGQQIDGPTDKVMSLGDLDSNSSPSAGKSSP